MRKKEEMRMMRWLGRMIPLIGFLFAAAPGFSYAQLPYGTSYFDANVNDWRSIQAIYVPDKTIRLALEEPVDIQIAPDDKVFVADKSADRVFILDRDGNPAGALGDDEGPGQLSGPEGVYALPDGSVYVADSGHERIVLFGPDGKLRREYKKPKSEYLADSFHFVPSKLAVDRRGVIYTVIKGNDQGLMRIGPEGDFRGFFGSNKAEQNYVNWLKRRILNKEQLAKEIANRPRPVTNVTMDQDGFIFTASTGIGSGNIKKLNAGGVDAFHNRNIPNTWGIVDVATDRNGLIYDVDTEIGVITIFDPTGTPLFSFGNMGDTGQRGVLGFPTGLAVNSRNEVWVTDGKLKNIQTYKRTAFGDTILTATSLYFDGRYEESKRYWEQVVRQNDMYNITFQGLGKIQLLEKDYDQALGNFKMSYDVKGYSDAFWDVRLRWVQEHFLLLCAAVAAGLAAVHYGYRGVRRFAASRTWPPSIVQAGADLKNLGYVLFHPYNGFYRLMERKVSIWILLLILLLALLVRVINLYATGFIFNPVDTSKINVYGNLLIFFALWVTWIISSYLVCSVKGGEAKFREVVQASVYALSPYILFSIPALLLSNVLVLEEGVLYHSIVRITLIWMAAMFFVMTQVVNNFDFLETVKNSLITLFALSILWFFLFIVSGLSYNLYDFFYQVYREVTSYA